MKFYSLIFLALLFLVTGANAQHTHYVKSDAAGSDDGTSWSNAFTSLQNALDAATSGDQVWVAVGTYRPDVGNGRALLDRSLSFEMKSGVRLHGGFVGTESSKAGRMPAVNRSVLSGDLQDDDDGFAVLDDNSFHVVVADGVDDDALLEGFYVVGGNANGFDSDSLGGGIRITGGAPWIINTRFNSSVAGCGGGVAVLKSGTPTMANTIVNGNRAATGGGICLQNSDPTLINSTITSNIARRAAGVYHNASSPRIDNSIIAENRSFADSDDCEIGQFPCSFVGIPEDILAASAEIMEAARDAWLSGSIDDAVAYLRAQPSVLTVFADTTVIAARVRSNTYEYLIDDSESEASKSVSEIDLSAVHTMGRNAWPGIQSSQPPYKRATGMNALSKKLSQVAGPRNIVGEDRNNDGRVDNRDGKRALIVAPYLEESVELSAVNLLLIPDYRNQVYFLGPEYLSSDNALTSFQIWDDYDLVYLHTLTQTISYEGSALVIYDTGLPRQTFTETQLSAPLRTAWLLAGLTPNIWISNRFFAETYRGTLDNMLFLCAGCHDSQRGAFDLANSLIRQSSTSVTTQGSLSETAITNLKLIGNLSSGVAIGEIEREWIAVGTNKLRIRELVSLHTTNFNTDNGDNTYQMYDGADITALINGTVGDSDPDAIRLFANVPGGIDRDAQIEFSYTIDGFTYSVVDFSPNRLPDGSWISVHNIPLGFPLEKGLLPIEVLAEGQGEFPFESRFSVLASIDAFNCFAKGSIGGFRSAAFSGPARWTPGSQSSSLYVRSGVDFATNTGTGGPNNYEAGFSLGPNTIEGEAFRFPITFGAVGHSNGQLDTWGIYDTGDNADCPECGGHVDVTEISADGTTYSGKFEFVGYDITASSGDPKPSTLTGSFRAMTGTTTDIRSPYFQCLMQYDNLEEASGILQR